MRPVLRTTLIVAVTAVVTFIATSAYSIQRIRTEVIPAMIAVENETEAFNDIGRVETLDELQAFIQRGCTKEALQLIEVKKSLLLSGIAQRMEQSAAVRKVVADRSQLIGERALVEAKDRNPPRSIPRCR